MENFSHIYFVNTTFFGAEPPWVQQEVFRDFRESQGPLRHKAQSYSLFSLFSCEKQLYKMLCPSMGRSVGQAFLENREFK